MKCLRFGAIFRHTSDANVYGPLWTRPVYAPCGHIFSLFSIFFLSYSFPKRLYHSPYHRQSHDRLFPSSQHHACLHPPYILLSAPHSPVICKDNFPLVYMYKSSRYYLVFDIDLGSIFLSHQLSKVLIQAPLQPSSTLATIASDFLVLLLSPIIDLGSIFPWSTSL